MRHDAPTVADGEVSESGGSVAGGESEDPMIALVCSLLVWAVSFTYLAAVRPSA